MDEFLIIIGLFTFLGIVVVLALRVLLVGCISFRSEFKKTGLPKKMYKQYVAERKRAAGEDIKAVLAEAAKQNSKGARQCGHRESAVRKYTEVPNYSQVMETERMIAAFKVNGVDLRKMSEEMNKRKK